MIVPDLSSLFRLLDGSLGVLLGLGLVADGDGAVLRPLVHHLLGLQLLLLKQGIFGGLPGPV